MKAPDQSSHEGTATTLEELERFRQDIERYRARRKAVSEEFEGFVRGFKGPAAAAPPRHARAAAAPPPPAPLPALPHDIDAASGPATRRSWVPGALVMIVIVALGLWWLGRTPSDSPEATGAPATTAAPAEAPSPAPPPAPPPADPFESVLTTSRPVWLRVMADGARVLNRELPAGARVPFKAERTIEIRAGDAGAVRLSIGGRDQGALGSDGAVVTRSFTVPR